MNREHMLQHQLVLQHKIEKLEPSYANAIVQYANIAKPSWISWYAFSAPDEAIQALINEAKSYYTRLPPIQHLPQLPLPQPPSMWFDYESPSLYLEPQFQVIVFEHPGDGMPRDYLNAEVKIVGSSVPELHNQRQSHPRGSQRDFFGHNQRQSHPRGSQRDFFGPTPEFKIYITITENRLTWKNIRDYFKKFGPVINVKIPCKPDNEKHNFGFVTFQNADTVSLLLSKSTSHSICGVEVRVKPYLERTKQEQRYRKLPQKNDYFDNVAHRISCVNAIEGHSGQKLPNFIEPSQEILKHRFEEIDSPLTHNLSEKKKESPEDDHETKESNVDESSELSAMERYLPHDLFSEEPRR